MSIISMASEASKFSLEKEKEWRVAAEIGGPSGLDCLRAKDWDTEKILKDAHGEALKDKDGKEIKVLGETILSKKTIERYLVDCGITDTLCDLTGTSEIFEAGYADWLYKQPKDDRYRRLDAEGLQWLHNVAPLGFRRYILLNKYEVYRKTGTETFMDKRVREIVQFIVHKREVQSANARASRAAVEQLFKEGQVLQPLIKDSEITNDLKEALKKVATEVLLDAYHTLLNQGKLDFILPQQKQLIASQVGSQEPHS